MNNNEFSFESIFAAGMGIPTDNTVVAQSEERFDGNFDTVFAEISRSEEDINFLETYGSLENYNTKAKLDMLNKINKAYGKCNRGIENYCRSLEAETEGTSAVKEEEKTAEAPKDTTKKTNWLINILGTIGRFFKKIWDTIIKTIKDWASRLKTIFAAKKAKNEIDEKTTAPTTTASSDQTTKDNLKKLIDTISKNINKLQPIVDKVNSKNNSIIQKFKQFANTEGKNNSELFNAINDELLVCSSGIKILGQLGNCVLKSMRFVMSNAKNIVKFGSSNFDNFEGRYTKTSMGLCQMYDQINKHCTGATKDMRQEFGENVYKTYTEAAGIIKEVLGINVPLVTKTDFTSPSTSGKKMSDVIKKLSSGLSEQITDMPPVVTKRLIKYFYGVELNLEAYNTSKK